MQTGSASKSQSGPRTISSSQDRQSNPDVLLATQVLQTVTKAIDLSGLKELVKGLKRARYFDLARQISTLAVTAASADPAMAVWFSQQQALCTYKDPDLPVDQRLDDALAILRETLALATTSVQETLGLAGAIFKRKWEIDGQTVQLERSLAFYRRGYQHGIGNDDGYTATNAAFVLDLLAAQDDRAAIEWSDRFQRGGPPCRGHTHSGANRRDPFGQGRAASCKTRRELLVLDGHLERSGLRPRSLR